MTPFARAYALALHNADPTRDMMDCVREAVRRENIKLRVAADRRAAKTFAKRSNAQKRAWRARKAKLREISKTA